LGLHKIWGNGDFGIAEQQVASQERLSSMELVINRYGQKLEFSKKLVKISHVMFLEKSVKGFK
jgi:hypothetical protein